MKLRLGQVVVSECRRRNWLRRALARLTKSPALQVWIVTFDQIAVEARRPHNVAFSVTERLQALIDNDQAFAVLDLPGMHLLDRLEVAMAAESCIGEQYTKHLVAQCYARGAKVELADDLLTSKLAVVKFHPSSRTRTVADLGVRHAG